MKIYNESNYNFTDIKVKGSDFTKDIGNLDNRSSTVVYYYPKYLDGGFYYRYSPIDTVRLVGKNNLSNFSIVFPRIEKGGCKTLCITKDLKLLEKLEDKKKASR